MEYYGRGLTVYFDVLPFFAFPQGESEPESSAELDDFTKIIYDSALSGFSLRFGLVFSVFFSG